VHVVDAEIGFEMAPIKFARRPHPGDLGLILHHDIQSAALELSVWLRQSLHALRTNREVAGLQAMAVSA
jgi:hypothetical protein